MHPEPAAAQPPLVPPDVARFIQSGPSIIVALAAQLGSAIRALQCETNA